MKCEKYDWSVGIEFEGAINGACQKNQLIFKSLRILLLKMYYFSRKKNIYRTF